MVQPMVRCRVIYSLHYALDSTARAYMSLLGFRNLDIRNHRMRICEQIAHNRLSITWGAVSDCARILDMSMTQSAKALQRLFYYPSPGDVGHRRICTDYTKSMKTMGWQLLHIKGRAWDVRTRL